MFLGGGGGGGGRQEGEKGKEGREFEGRRIHNGTWGHSIPEQTQCMR